ncbi:MAG: hypothetical protein ACOY5R_06555 [Pseudomonadota bacterium]
MSGPIYESQTRAMAMPVELRRGPAAGAIVGEGLQGFGQTADRVADIQRERERASLAADRAVAFAQVQSQIGDELDQLKREAPADAAGFEEKAASIVEQRTQAFIDTLSDREIRNAFLPNVAQYRGRVIGATKAYAIEARAGKLANDVQTAVDINRNALLRSPTPDNWTGFTETVDTLMGQLQGMLPADKIDELRRQSIEGGAISYATGMPPKELETKLKEGAFDTLLPANKLLALRSANESDLRQIAAQETALKNQAKAEKREQLATAEALLNAGTGKPQAWSALADEYAALGDTSKAVELRAKAASTSAAIGYRGMTLPQIDAELARLTAAETQKGGLSASENSLRTGLQEVRRTVSSLIGQSPMLAASYATGTEPPAPINWSDPASIDARALKARAAARQYGQRDVKPLLPSEIDELRSAYASPGGKATVLDRVRLFGDDAASAARQVANDPAFVHLASLSASSPSGRNAAMQVLQGEEILKTAKGVWAPGVKGDADTQWRAYAQSFADSPSLGTALYQTAKAIYAFESASAGDLDQTGLNEQRWKSALDRAAGGDGRGRGGIIAMNGGQVILPPSWTEQEFAQTIARAGQAEWTRAAEGRNAYVGGRLVTLSEIRKAVPVPIDDSRYAFRIGDGYVTNSARQTWTVDINLLRGK